MKNVFLFILFFPSFCYSQKLLRSEFDSLKNTQIIETDYITLKDISGWELSFSYKACGPNNFAYIKGSDTAAAPIIKRSYLVELHLECDTTILIGTGNTQYQTLPFNDSMRFQCGTYEIRRPVLKLLAEVNVISIKIIAAGVYFTIELTKKSQIKFKDLSTLFAASVYAK